MKAVKIEYENYGKRKGYTTVDELERLMQDSEATMLWVSDSEDSTDGATIDRSDLRKVYSKRYAELVA